MTMFATSTDRGSPSERGEVCIDYMLGYLSILNYYRGATRRSENVKLQTISREANSKSAPQRLHADTLCCSAQGDDIV